MSKKTQPKPSKKKNPTKIFDIEARKIFFAGFRGNNKGTLNPTIRKHIDNGLLALEEKGYV